MQGRSRGERTKGEIESPGVHGTASPLWLCRVSWGWVREVGGRHTTFPVLQLETVSLFSRFDLDFYIF